jgi:hypothetical protein
MKPCLSTRILFDLAVLDGDLDLVMQHAHADVAVREAPGLPYSKDTYVGRQGLVELMEVVGGWWEFLKATGREVQFLVTEWMTVRDGKVADIEVFYFDEEPLLEAARLASAET